MLRINIIEKGTTIPLTYSFPKRVSARCELVRSLMFTVDRLSRSDANNRNGCVGTP